jgi:hypothetical protein
MTGLVDLKYFYFLMYYVYMSGFLSGGPPSAPIFKNKNKDMTTHQKSARKSQCQV